MRYLKSLFLKPTRSMVTIARVAELVDAADSKSAARKGVPVQVRPLVPSCNKPTKVGFFVPNRRRAASSPTETCLG